MAEKKKPGRPTKFEPKMLEQARKLCLLGATNEDLADFFEVDAATIARWIAEGGEFCESVKGAKEELDGKVVRRLFERATGYEHPDTHFSAYEGVVTATPTVKRYPPDPTAAIFWLKNRRPAEWRDRVEHTGKDGKDLIPETDIKEVARGLAYLLTAGASA